MIFDRDATIRSLQARLAEAGGGSVGGGSVGGGALNNHTIAAFAKNGGEFYSQIKILRQKMMNFQ